MERTRWLPFALVSLLAAAPYLSTIRFGFVFDDRHLILHNAFLHETWSPLEAFAHHFWHGTVYGAAYYRPFVVASFALNGRLLGWGPAGYHLVNLLLHIANATLLLSLARRLGSPVWAAFFAAALFAVHPVTAWPVASVVARVDLLPALFILLAWHALILPANAGTAGRGRGDRARALITGGFFLMALLSKESAAAFLVVPMVTLWTRTRPDDRGGPGRPVLASILVALVVYLGLRRAAGLALLPGLDLIDPLTNPVARLPAPTRLFAALRLAGRYVLYLVAPTRFADSANYFDAATWPGGTDPAVLLAEALLLAWSGMIFLLCLRRDPVAAPLTFSLASFLPASNLLFPIGSLYAQNFLYLPLAGLCLGIALTLGRLPVAARTTSVPPFRRSRLPAVCVAAPLLAVLAFAAHREAEIWRDEVSLFTAWSARFPGYPPAHSALGVALLDRGEPALAIAPLRACLVLTDRSAEAHYNLGVALLLTDRGGAGAEEALSHLHRALELAPEFPPARANCARALLLLDRPREAVEEAREALRLAPDFAPARDILREALARAGKEGPVTTGPPR